MSDPDSDAPYQARCRREDEFHAAVTRYARDNRDELYAALVADIGEAATKAMPWLDLDKALRDLAAPIVDRLFSEPVERDDGV